MRFLANLLLVGTIVFVSGCKDMTPMEHDPIPRFKADECHERLRQCLTKASPDPHYSETVELASAAEGRITLRSRIGVRKGGPFGGAHEGTPISKDIDAREIHPHGYLFDSVDDRYVVSFFGPWDLPRPGTNFNFNLANGYVWLKSEDDAADLLDALASVARFAPGPPSPPR